MLKEINRISFTMEHFNGDSYMSFILSIKEDGSIEIVDTDNCSCADTDGDYIFDTDNDLYRIQADEPIDECEYERIWDCYNEYIGKYDNE